MTQIKYPTLSGIQKGKFLSVSGYPFDDRPLEDRFMTDRPNNRVDWKYSPWAFSYIYQTDTGYLICELVHRMTNNRVYGWDKYGTNLDNEITEAIYPLHL